MGEQPVLRGGWWRAARRRGAKPGGGSTVGTPHAEPGQATSSLTPGGLCVSPTTFHLRSPWDALTEQELGAATSYYNYKILLYTFLTFPPSFSFSLFFF